MDWSEDSRTPPAAPPVLSVSELNRMARRALEAQLPLLWVEGEVSNFTRAASGHWYFSLKDATAQVRCVMFRGRNQFADFTPANGDHVEIRALASLYEARGEFQLGAESIRRAGAGRLYKPLSGSRPGSRAKACSTRRGSVRFRVSRTVSAS